MFGPENLSVKLDHIKLMYPPVVFSQVNEAMLPAFARLAKEMLSPEKEDHLMDLYCGYGLLGLSMADSVKSVTGVEIDGPAVKAGSANASFLFKQKNIRFVKGEISPALLRTKLPERDPGRRELLVLDPPRMGTAGGVIRELAKRHPEKVLHIVCGTDEIPREVQEWKKYGYSLKQIRPVDMFPGTAGLETFLLFEPVK
jgi:tRNA/tmRNA/rRNA uracil-C5-methylase (TrmA/RlmC/RlmD family)